MRDRKFIVEWSDELSVGILSIDTEHQAIVKLINELYLGFVEHEDLVVLDKKLRQLVMYTNEHFKHEERLFDEHHWGGARLYIKEHVDLASKLNGLKQEFSENGESTQVYLQIVMFLQSWIKIHINTEDKEYSEFLISKGVK